ncbi:hypothetical protein GC197_09310 [bacterium]|nr:hypothetical protein [bacterium]
MYRNYACLGCWVIVLLLFGFHGPAQAEISPENYEKLQNEAGEAIQIEVQRVCIRVRLDDANAPIELETIASVISVNRTHSGLRPGKVIKIVYTPTGTPEPAPGLRPLTLLEPGKRYAAYLDYQEPSRTYQPAARGYSFESPPANHSKQDEDSDAKS